MENIDIDNHILKFVVDSVNPINNTLYIEVYNTLARDNNLLDLDDKLLYLMNRVQTVDSAYIPIGINTIFLEVFRNVFNTLGVMVRWDITLRDALALYDLLIEVRDHTNIVDLLKSITEDNFDLFIVTYKLDLDVVSLFEYIIDYSKYKESLYSMYKEELVTDIEDINT